MKRTASTPQRWCSALTAAALVVSQLALPPRAEAAHLGSSTASAGSAPPPAVSAVQSFQPDLFTGRATTGVPIAVPPGRKGMQPSLGLSYSSSGRNGWVGVGWGLDVGSIERSTKNGVPRYDSSDTYTFMFQGVSSNLVRIPDGTYRAKDEGLFLRVESLGAAGWEIRDKSGTRYLFGQTAASQIENAGNVFRWCLEQVLDVNGNSLTITYTKDQNQLYPAQIRYTAHEPTGLAPSNQVDVTLEARPDVETSYRSGFPITTAKRLKTIETKTTVAADGGPAVGGAGTLALARRYQLAYTTSARTGRSLLASVTQVGTDGITSLPPLTFTYTSESPTYLHCHNCVPSISSGNHGWQLQYAVGNLFPRDDGGNDQRLWPSGSCEPGQKCWSEQVCQDVKTCRKVFFWTSCDHQTVCQTVTNCAAIPQVSWSSPQLDLAGASGGVSWSTDPSGNLSVSGPQDTHILAMTWLYTATAKTVSLSSLSPNGRADVFYVPPGGSTWSVASGNQVPLNPGWTVVAVTAYNETGSFSLSMSANLASAVSAMNHAQFSPMGVAGDFNGDGYTDLAHLAPTDNHWHVVLNSGSGFGSEQTWLSLTLPAETIPMVGDVDADGKTDLVLWNSSSGLWQVARSTGSSFQAPVTWHGGFSAGQTPFMGDVNGDGFLDVGTFSGGTWTMALSTGSSFGSPTTWLSGFGSGATPLTGDFNGDGLTDVAADSGGTISVALSDGTRFVPQPTAWSTGFGTGQSVTSADLNGDGLTDMLYYDKSTGAIVSAPSTGQGFSTAQTLMSDHPFGLRGTDDTLQVGDFRGNGLSGFGVFNALSGAAEIAFALGTPTDLLLTTANGIGGTTTLTYQPSSQFTNTNLHFAMPVVTQTSLSDGLGHTYTTNYAYSGGLYDTSAKEFRGFQKATVTDAIGTMTTTTFSQDLHTKGRSLNVEVRDSTGHLYTKTVNTHSCTEPYPGVHVAKLNQLDGFIYDGDDTFRQVRSRFSYDQYGNLTTTYEDGQVDPPLTGDEHTTTIAFTYNTTDWILNKPSLIQMFDASGTTVVAQRRFTYDGAATLDAAPTQGRLTREEEWRNLPTDQWLATTLTYDAYGNVAAVTDALGRTTANTYDPTGTYLTTIANTLGHTRQLAYDPRVGAVTRSTDQNNVASTTVYDALGRVTKVIGPTDTAALPTIRYEYDLSTVPARTTVHARIASGQAAVLTTTTFTDGLGLTIQTRAPAENPTKQVVTGAVEFDSRGQVAKQWVSYLDAVSTAYVSHTLVPGLAPPVTYTYDPVGRLIQTTDPDGSVTKTRYHDGLVITTDANGHETWRTTDAYGRLVTVDEVLSTTEMATTTYQHDTLSNLTKVTDAKGNVTTITYDSLSRKLAMDDPDMGHWTYAYDAVDNLTSQTDARGVVMNFTYDNLNRLTQKSYVIPAGSPVANPGTVTYTYDNVAKPFSKGKLTSITDGSGSSSFEYDTLGRLIKESKTIDGTTSTIQRSYDLLGRLTALTYPDTAIASYTYNAQGGLETVALDSLITGHSSLVTAVDYNAAGQLTRLALGNGAVSDYTYDPQTLHLSQLRTTGASGTLQDFSYQFDPVGNVTQITDAVHTGTQSFEYDPLHRLTKAIGSYGTSTYGYDAVGNMTQKEGRLFSYGMADGTKPHAVTSAVSDQLSAVSLTYDANGNLLSKGSSDSLTHVLTPSLYSYDAENRLTEVKTAPTETVAVTFQPGWNFFSLPVIPDDVRITTLFPNFSANFEQVARVVSTGAAPGSTTYAHYVGEPRFDDFSTLEYGTSYQVSCKAASPVTVEFTGHLPSQTLSKSLAAGWHLLPYLGLTSQSVAQAFAGVDVAQVKGYDTASGSLTTPTQVQPGQSYWVHVRTASTFSPSLPRDPTTRFVYDGDGGRVKQITAAGTTTFLGELAEIAPDGTTTKYVFAGSQRIASITHTPQQQAALREPKRWWAKAWAAVLAFLDIPTAEAAELASSLRFFHGDHLDSTNLVTDGTGAVVERTEHMPFGSVASAWSAQPRATSRIGFTGQREDAGTGLILFPARAYDPELGRFLQPDPFVQDPADPQTLNRYAYVRNNPVNFVDPSGNFWQFIVAAIAAVFVVAAVVSVIASTVSLIASATGHENTARRAANVAVTAGWVVVGAAAVFTLVQPETGGGALRASGWILAYAYTAQAVANRDQIQQTAADLGVSEQAAETVASAQFKLVAQEQPSPHARAPVGRFGDHTVVQGPLGPRFIDPRGQIVPYPNYTDPLGISAAIERMADSLIGNPARTLRASGRILSESGHPGIGRFLSSAGLLLEPGGPGKIVGIAALGQLGAGVGRAIGSGGGVVGGIIGGVIGGAIGSQFDDPGAAYLNYGE